MNLRLWVQITICVCCILLGKLFLLRRRQILIERVWGNELGRYKSGIVDFQNGNLTFVLTF